MPLFKKKSKKETKDKPISDNKQNKKSEKLSTRKSVEEEAKRKQEEDKSKEEEIKRKKEEELRKIDEERLQKEKEELRLKEEDEARKKEEERINTELNRLKMEAEDRKKMDEEKKLKLEQEKLLKLEKKKDKMKNMKGFLDKKGHVRKNWNIRFFVVENGDTIKYYIDNTLSKLKGSFSLNGIKIIEEEEAKGKQFAFSVTEKSGKIFLLSAATAKEKQTWIRTLAFLSTGVLSEYKVQSVTPRISQMEFSGSRLAKTGWLSKQGKFSIRPNEWKRRWCILEDIIGTDKISYFTQEGGSLKGSIQLQGCTVQRKEIEGNVNTFSIHTQKKDKKREYVLSADSDQDMKEWVLAVTAATKAIAAEKR